MRPLPSHSSDSYPSAPHNVRPGITDQEKQGAREANREASIEEGDKSEQLTDVGRCVCLAPHYRLCGL